MNSLSSRVKIKLTSKAYMKETIQTYSIISLYFTLEIKKDTVVCSKYILVTRTMQSVLVDAIKSSRKNTKESPGKDWRKDIIFASLNFK